MIFNLLVVGSDFLETFRSFFLSRSPGKQRKTSFILNESSYAFTIFTNQVSRSSFQNVAPLSFHAMQYTSDRLADTYPAPGQASERTIHVKTAKRKFLEQESERDSIPHQHFLPQSSIQAQVVRFIVFTPGLLG